MSIFFTQIRIYAEPEPGVSPILVRLSVLNISPIAHKTMISATIQNGEFLSVPLQIASQDIVVVNLLGGALNITAWDLQQPTLYALSLSLPYTYFSASPPREWEKGGSDAWKALQVGFRRLRWNDLTRTLSINSKPVTLENLKRVEYSDAIDISAVLDICDGQGEGVILCVSAGDFPQAVASLANHASVLVWQLTDVGGDETARCSLSRLDETRPVWAI
jgi:hypothetical protein